MLTFITSVAKCWNECNGVYFVEARADGNGAERKYLTILQYLEKRPPVRKIINHLKSVGCEVTNV